MAGRFDVRFNLKYELEPEVKQGYLDEFEQIQYQQTESVKSMRAEEVKLLKGKKVLFVGDSITSDNLGYRVTVTRAAELDAIDASLSGGTSSMLLYDSVRAVQKKEPELVSVMLGSNDSVSILREGLYQVSIGEYERNMRELIGRIADSNATLLLFKILPVEEKIFYKSFSPGFKYQTNQTINEYNTVLDKVAAEHGIKTVGHPWLESVADKASLYEPDGIHLSVKGQKLFAENWLAVAAKLFNK